MRKTIGRRAVYLHNRFGLLGIAREIEFACIAGGVGVTALGIIMLATRL